MAYVRAVRLHRPINATSRKAYRGINTVCLWAAAEAKGYESGEWGTYKQWQERGAQVRKGEKSTTVVFWKFANSARESQDDARRTASAAVRACCSRGAIPCSMPPRWTATRRRLNPKHTMPERIERAEAFFQSHRGRSAARRQSRVLLARCRIIFRCRHLRHSSRTSPTIRPLAHEHTHWTAKADRCDRQLGKRFGDNAYAAEELIAELGAAFVCAHLGLSTEPREDHAAIHSIVAEGSEG